MTVIVPPKMAAYDSGKSIFFLCTPVRVHQAMMMGVSSETMGVLFRKADSTSTGTIIRNCAQCTERASPRNLDMTRSRPPVW